MLPYGKQFVFNPSGHKLLSDITSDVDVTHFNILTGMPDNVEGYSIFRNAEIFEDTVCDFSRHTLRFAWNCLAKAVSSGDRSSDTNRLRVRECAVDIDREGDAEPAPSTPPLTEEGKMSSRRCWLKILGPRALLEISVRHFF